MEIVNCTWELKNLEKNTIEIIINPEDIFSPNDYIGHNCDYLVVKVPSGKIDFRLGLPKIGFAQIESQFAMSKLYSSFDFENPLIRSLIKKTNFKVVTTSKELDDIFTKMTPLMFSSDRICLDPEFGPEVGLRRYKNWMTSEFKTGKSTIINIINRGKTVGFSMFRICDGICNVQLGGIYEEFQNNGLGLLTPISPVLYLHQKNIYCRIFETSISSNNYPVLEFYNFLNYKINKITNVFIKHQNIEYI